MENTSTLYDIMSIIIGHAVAGLLTDDAACKQWCLEQILVAVGIDLVKLEEELATGGESWEKGVPLPDP